MIRAVHPFPAIRTVSSRPAGKRGAGRGPPGLARAAWRRNPGQQCCSDPARRGGRQREWIGGGRASCTHQQSRGRGAPPPKVSGTHGHSSRDSALSHPRRDHMRSPARVGHPEARQRPRRDSMGSRCSHLRRARARRFHIGSGTPQVHTKDLRLALLKYAPVFRPRLHRNSPHLHRDSQHLQRAVKAPQGVLRSVGTS